VTAPDLAVVKKAEPFAALIGVLSLVVGLLYVGGFCYRWAYFYNFGVQHLVFKLSTQSVFMTSFELIRTWPHAFITAKWVLLPLIALNVLLGALRWATARRGFAARATTVVAGALGLTSPLALDVLRTMIIVLGTSRAGYAIGYRSFQAHVANTPNNPLPAVTVVFDGKDAGAVASVRCGATPDGTAPIALVGNSLDDLQNNNRTCNHGAAVWRLLFRDDDAIYVFASELPTNVVRRPLTLVLPQGKSAVLVTE
jgi:hypothetical protein